MTQRAGLDVVICAAGAQAKPTRNGKATKEGSCFAVPKTVCEVYIMCFESLGGVNVPGLSQQSWCIPNATVHRDCAAAAIHA